MSNTTAVPSTVAEIVENIRAIHPLLRENAAAGDRERRAQHESITALRQAGAFKVVTPKRYGGLGGSLQDMLDVSAAVAYADGGTAWVTMLGNVGGWLTSLMSREVQDAVWGEDSDAFVTGVLAPTAEVVRVDGGYRVTGKWYYNSGSYQSTWGIIGIPVPNEAGEIVDQALAILPREDYEIEDTWFVTGMRSSESNCMVANDVFVPDNRVMSVPPAIGGQYSNTDAADAPGNRMAFVPVLALVLIGPQLGLGRAAFDYVVEKTATKAVSYSFFATQAESTAIQLKLAEIAQLLDTAELHARRAAADVDSYAEAGTYPDTLIRARVRADTALVAENVTRAIDMLISVHGAGAFAEVNPLQRIWRDSNTAARHAIVNPLISYEAYGKAIVGDERPVSPLV